MTNEEAIAYGEDYLRNLSSYATCKISERHVNFVKMAVAALKAEPCEDAVSRENCLNALSHMMDTDGFRDGWAVSRANVECMLKAMPPVTPKQKTGKWIVEKSELNITVKCSCCNYIVNYFWSDWNKANYCPNCGAKMEGESE